MQSDQRNTSTINLRLRMVLPSAILAAAGLAFTAAAAQPPAASGLQTYRLDTALNLQKSDSPRDWALGSQLLETTPASGASLRERARILQRAAQAAPDDRLVQTLWANLPLKTGGSRFGQPYGGHWTALTRLDPLNGVAWVAVIDHAWKTGNTHAVDAGLIRMANTESYNEHLGEAVTAWRDVFSRYPPPPPAKLLPRYGQSSSEGMDASDMVFIEAVSSATPPVQSLINACSKSEHPKAAARRFQACGKIARLMMGRAQTLVGRLYGVAILRASHAGTKADVGIVRAVTWQNEQNEAVTAIRMRNPYAKQNHLDLLRTTDSEVQAIQYELRISGIPLMPPDDWKQTVNGKQIEPLDDPSGSTP